MLERRELGFLHQVQGKEKQFNEYKRQIYSGLDLEGAAFLKLPKTVEEGMLNDISSSMIRLSEHLNIPLPKIGLIHGWNEFLEGYDEDPFKRDVLANALVDENHPEGIISFSPFYIKSEITRRMGIEQTPPLPFELVLPHEAFHLWQFKNQTKKVMEDCMAFSKDGLQAWNLTQTETDAREFANNWLKNNFKNKF